MKDFDELADGLNELPDWNAMEDTGLEKQIERQINRRITRISLRTLFAVIMAAAVLLLIINPVMKFCSFDPRPLFTSYDAAYENEFTKYMRIYYETAQPYVTVYDSSLKDLGFGRYAIDMGVMDTSGPIYVGLPPNVRLNVKWGTIGVEDPQRLTTVTASRYGYGLMSEEDKAALMEELEELPDSSIIHVSLSAREEKPVSEVIAAPVQVNWVEIYSEDGEIRGGLTIRKSILGEGERDRVEMTDEEIKQEYLGNLEYLLSQPKLLNALGLRMGSEGRYFQAPTTVEPIKNLLDQTAKQAVLTTKNYCISGKKQEILDYLNTVDYTSVMVDRVRLSILER